MKRKKTKEATKPESPAKGMAVKGGNELKNKSPVPPKTIMNMAITLGLRGEILPRPESPPLNASPIKKAMIE